MGRAIERLNRIDFEARCRISPGIFNVWNLVVKFTEQLSKILDAVFDGLTYFVFRVFAIGLGFAQKRYRRHIGIGLSEMIT